MAEGSTVDPPPPPRGDLDKPGHRSWIVVSPDGVLYHADKEVGKVWWGYPTGKGIYNVDRDDYVNDYVDLGPADNDTDMYRWYKPNLELQLKRELIYYKKEEELRAYLKSVYAETTTVSKEDSEIYVNYKTGKTEDDRSKDVLLVKRTDYYLHKNSPRPWSLRFTNFLVYFPTKFKDLEAERTRCVVRHTRNVDEFIKVCYKYQISRLPNEGLLNTLISKVRKIEMPYRPPAFAKGNHGTVFVRGTFAGFEVLVKMVKKRERDLRSVIDNYRSVQNHESIVTLYACESDEKFYYFAMEECQHSLREHVAAKPYVEMNYESMKLMRSLVAGVAHMHARNIVHRNLNPSNILVDNNDTAKICGFGNSILQINGQTSKKKMNGRYYNTQECHIVKPLNIYNDSTSLIS